jgi:hypothetical protein
MGLLTRAALPAAVLPLEEVDCPALGGSVIVRGLDMTGMIQWNNDRRRLSAPLDGEDEEAARQRAGSQLIAALLALAVHLEDGPAYTAAQWQALGARHPDDVMRLFQVAMRLSGQDADHEKKA